jgi:hypothetical protein
LFGKSEGKGTLGRPGYKWEGTIQTNLKETEWEIVERIHLAQNRNDLQVP